MIKDCIVTIDAMDCLRALAEKIAEGQGDYLLSVKSNQEVLLDDIVKAFNHTKTADEYIKK
jgi:predicted transposase YbfD/YdcC